MKNRKALLHAAAMMLAWAGPGAPLAHAQEERWAQPATGEVADTYGTGSTTDHVLQAYAFGPRSGDGANFIANTNHARGCAAGPCSFMAPVMLPAGAVIEALQLEACDTSPGPGEQVVAGLYRSVQLEAAVVTLAAVVTGATPGCAFFTAILAPPHTVNNDDGTYVVEVFMGSGTLTNRFQAVRIVYRLQVSPAPATATFPSDVPTSHPFFRFVEALAAAGITGGCGAGAYCPDAPVTRGQMAVFLATALGLHFPN
jgi:hypothetical protein